MSIIDHLTCGLALIIIYKYLTTSHTMTKNSVCKKNVKGKILLEKHDKKTIFGAYYFNKSYTTFLSKYPLITQIYGIEKQKKFSKSMTY